MAGFGKVGALEGRSCALDPDIGWGLIAVVDSVWYGRIWQWGVITIHSLIDWFAKVPLGRIALWPFGGCGTVSSPEIAL